MLCFDILLPVPNFCKFIWFLFFQWVLAMHIVNFKVSGACAMLHFSCCSPDCLKYISRLYRGFTFLFGKDYYFFFIFLFPQNIWTWVTHFCGQFIWRKTIVHKLTCFVTLAMIIFIMHIHHYCLQIWEDLKIK